MNKTCKKSEEELNYHTTYRSLFLLERKRFIGGAMFGGIITLFLHCCLILGRESDKKWEEDQTMKKEKKNED